MHFTAPFVGAMKLGPVIAATGDDYLKSAFAGPFPKNVITDDDIHVIDDACLKRCGLTRETAYPARTAATACGPVPPYNRIIKSVGL